MDETVAPSADPRRPEDVRYDAISDQIREVAALVHETVSLVREHAQNSGNVQTVIHKSEGMGGWGAAAVTACFATWIMLILFALELHDLHAWKDVHNNAIAALKAAIDHWQEKGK